MDGHRRYDDEPEPGWYAGQSQTPNSRDSGVHERPSGAFRLPDRRPADGYGTSASYAATDPMTSTGSHALAPQDTGTRIPVRGPEYPTVRPTGGGTALAGAPGQQSSAATSYRGPTSTYGGPASPASGVPSQGFGSTGRSAEPTTAMPPTSRFGPGAAQRVFRNGRPVSAVLFAVVSVVLMVPTLLLLIRVTFVDNPTVRSVVPAVLLTSGLLLTGIGLFRLAAAGGEANRDVWFRPPVAYLPVGLVLLLAAGLAVT